MEIGADDYTKEADRWPGPSLSGEDLKVGILVLFFSFLNIYTTAHCFGSLIDYFSGTCVKEVEAS